MHGGPVCTTHMDAAHFPPPFPPWLPGAAPPVPGPVFSPAFKALLVLMFFGCGYLCITLRDQIKAINASQLGEDNENIMMRGEGNRSAWLAQIQKTRGHRACTVPIPSVEESGRARKGGAKIPGGSRASKTGGHSKRSTSRAENDDDEPSRPRKSNKAKREKGDATEMQALAAAIAKPAATSRKGGQMD